MINSALKALRPHQWVKNILLFVPLILSHQLHERELLLHAALAFLSFSFCASAFYVFNDLLDIEADRAHPRKRNRPFAAGELQVRHGILLITIMLGLSMLAAFPLPIQFLTTLVIYAVLTQLYSYRLKKIAILDIIVLASFYAIRIVAGGVATDVLVSPWLLAFSMFMFLSLACVKRYSEILLVREQNGEKAQGRGYLVEDAELITQLGTSSGYISVLVLALYLNSSDVTTLYHSPGLLWFICPAVLYWISRVWLLAHRGVLHDDPIVFALQDKVSYLTGAISALLVYLAIQG